MSKEYYLGLDMGTSSVGWAVTDKDYNLVRAKGKDLWGVRLFKEAETSAERRQHRTSRRRIQRERARIGFVRQIFANAIDEIDPGFYQRLDDSKYIEKDKNEQQPFALFSGDKFTDKEYYAKYPTISHLRKELCLSTEPHDVRLVFLAILNIFKHRGHFLNSNIGSDGIGNLKDIISPLCDDIQIIHENEICNKLGNILSSKELSNSRKYESIIELLDIDKKSNISEMLKLICGLTATISKVFPNNAYNEENIKKKLSFRDSGYDEKMAEIELFLSEENFEKISVLKQVFDWSVLSALMRDGVKTLSEARVLSYEKHHNDLKLLQKVYREFRPDLYDNMFRKMEDNSYSAYVGSVNSKYEKARRAAKSSIDDFYKRIKKDLSSIQDANVEYILGEMEKGSFLPKQLTNANGVIPNQLHSNELKLILKNAENYLDFLNERDEKGLTNSEKIIQMFEFNIPYYIGPLYNDHKHTAWSIRKDSGRVYPWNIEEKIDLKKSAEEFINRMVNDCTYMTNEKVLPKNSLMYEKFMVLNELNNLRVNGEKITVELKQSIYKELLTNGKKLTVKKIIEHLRKNGMVGANEEVDISGIDGDLTNTLTNYSRFKGVFGVDILTYEQEHIAEKIVFWSTVYGDSRKFLREKIKEEYADVFNDKQIEKILGYKFKDWGRLSKAFLELNGEKRQTGESKSIISRMWDENYNLMQLLSNDFTYLSALEESNDKIEKLFSELEYEDLDDYKLSAPVKRMVWQTMLVVKEVTGVLGGAPSRIFIEMARDNKSPKERKDSRKKILEDLYKQCKEDSRKWLAEMQNHTEADFRSKKLYLYYTQKGRCMYTGDAIEIDDLFNDNLYDIDHIYPRHFVKDDSIENNLVLVKKEKNAHKSDSFPIEGVIQTKNRKFWKSLLDGGFITKEKFARLTRTDDFTDSERAAFISRQLVETRQGTKVIASLFKSLFANSEIIYTKAENVSDFRKKYNMIKCREINDFHHANDAYLNIVVGNTYYVKFTNNPLNYIKEYRNNPKNYEYHMDKIFDHKVKRGNDIAWDVEKDRSISIVKKVMSKTTPLITRMCFERKGNLSDINAISARIISKVNGVGYIPTKLSDEKLNNTSIYGGYGNLTRTYFFLVEHGKSDKRVRTIEDLPLYLKNIADNIEMLEKYASEELHLVNPIVKLAKIKMYSLIKVNGFYLYLTGVSKTQLLVSNAVQMKLNYDNQMYIKKISRMNSTSLSDEDFEKYGITKECNVCLYDNLADKYSKNIFVKRPNAVGDKLISWRDSFIELDCQNQLYVLNQILQLSQCSNNGADLLLIGGVKSTGKMTLNKKISDKNEFKLINLSPAGLFGSEIDLLTV